MGNGFTGGLHGWDKPAKWDRVKTFIPTAKTVPFLQRDLITEIEGLLENVNFKKADGTTQEGIKGYMQQLPKLQSDDDDPDQYFPYFVVRHVRSQTTKGADPWYATIDILFGIYDDDDDNTGHFQVENACQRVVDRFAYEPLLNQSWRCEPDMEVVMQEDDTYPYFFGGIELKFQMPKIRRNDEFS